MRCGVIGTLDLVGRTARLPRVNARKKISAVDWMGAIYTITTSVDHQRKGISKAPMLHAEGKIGALGAGMKMIEPIGNSGHETARSAYEAIAFERWPIALY